MFICSICGRSVESPAVYSLDPTHSICTVCVHKFDDLVKNPDNEAFRYAYEYFSFFVDRGNSDPYTKSAVNYYLEQNRAKYQNLCENKSEESIAEFLKKGNEEIENLKDEIQKIKTEKEEKEQQEQKKEKAREKEVLLDSIGLYSFVREYALNKPFGYYPIQTDSETIDNQVLYWSNGKKIYPEISDDEFEKIKDIVAKKEDLEKEKKEQLNPTPDPIPECEPEPLSQPEILVNLLKKELDSLHETKKKPLSLRIRSTHVTDSFAESLLRILAYIDWISGLIISIIISRREVYVSTYRTETQFSWSIFLVSILFFFLNGSVMMCLSELFGNVNSISQRFAALTLDQIDESEKWHF